ncbi:alcohol dehydrogenase [Enemella evansiae]|uniref:NADP-dependent oxidoreductase n=1 Tax=Enemella evansiae TaxID=2016499 RepID=UPI000B9604B5|nr:NADP-dependent oxidoreductase [Enemella evansiae]OYO18874.1 alcohol dehydrogenase [Enemella evansiae]
MQIKRWVAQGFSGLDDFAFVDAELGEPGPGEVTIAIEAAGVNPADLKHVTRGGDPAKLPIPIGYEVAGRIAALGPDTTIASGGGAVGDPVLAFRIYGGYATAITAPAVDVFARPASLPVEQAANLLLAGTTAAEMLDRVHASAGEVIVVHAASGAVGAIVLQLARLRGITVLGTCGERSDELVRGFGGIPVRYGDGLLERIRETAPGPVVAALDCAGTDEAVDASLALVAERDRIVTVAAPARARQGGFHALAGNNPDSARFRDGVRAELIELAGRGELVVPMAGSYPLTDAVAALRLVGEGHAGGNVALLPESH